MTITQHTLRLVPSKWYPSVFPIVFCSLVLAKATPSSFPFLLTSKSLFWRCFAPRHLPASARRPFDWLVSPQRRGARQTFPSGFVFECRVLGVCWASSAVLLKASCPVRGTCVLTCSGKERTTSLSVSLSLSTVWCVDWLAAGLMRRSCLTLLTLFAQC